MKQILIGMIFGIILTACTTLTAIHYIVPEIPPRPAVTFKSTQGSHDICLSLEDTQQLLKYIETVETRFKEASKELEEINRSAK